MKKIALIYSKKDKNDAIHTKEVLENELNYHRVSFSKKRNQLIVEGVTIFLIDIEKEITLGKSKVIFNETFATNAAVKKYGDLFIGKSDKVHNIPYPSQAIVDIVLSVLETKKENEKVIA